jgi:hypothetical protein
MAAYGGCLIGKSGGATLFEAFTKGARILVDKVDPSWSKQASNTFLSSCSKCSLRTLGFQRQLPWEKVNSEFAHRNGISETFHTEKAFLPKLEEILTNNNTPVQLNIEVKKFGEEVTKSCKKCSLKRALPQIL